MNPDEKQGDAQQPADAARPNASYKLSKQFNPAESEHPVFYYNREQRLDKAPQQVRDLYSGQKRTGFNLLRPLVGTRSSAILFFTILILSLSMVFLTLSGYLDTSYALEGNQLSFKATRFEGIVIVTLKKTLEKKNKSGAQAYTGAVDLAVAPVVRDSEEDYPVFYHRVFFSLEREEEYRFAVPFDSPELALVLQTEKSTLTLKIKPE